MSQLLLFPDRRPLVERLGRDFFRLAPQRPGVYLMRDAADEVVYVGKARNLRQRLGHYRVANPDRVSSRHLRLLNRVERIEIQECADEAAALARESDLLRNLRPAFNRAGTWVGDPQFLCWRVASSSLELAIRPSAEPEWRFWGSWGAGARFLRALLARLTWQALKAPRGLEEIPAGWMHGRLPVVVRITSSHFDHLEQATRHLQGLVDGAGTDFADWVRERTESSASPFAKQARDADLEELAKFSTKRARSDGRLEAE